MAFVCKKLYWNKCLIEFFTSLQSTLERLANKF